MIKLRTYQQGLYDGIQNKLNDKNVRSICAVLPTGGGKSVVIAKLAEDLQGSTEMGNRRSDQGNQSATQPCPALHPNTRQHRSAGR